MGVEARGRAFQERPYRPAGLLIQSIYTGHLPQTSDSKDYPPMINECLLPDGSPRDLYAPIFEWMDAAGYDAMPDRIADASRAGQLESFTFLLDPLTFRPTPVDLFPRLISATEWEQIAAGVEQRQRALNHFLLDLYCGQQTIVPPEVVYTCQYFYPEAVGIRPRSDVYVHVYGVDLVRDTSGEFIVLEDNLRIPSGISYQLKTRELASRMIPELVDLYSLAPYSFADAFKNVLNSLASDAGGEAVILTDSKYGSAFFEHRYLSELLDVPLVEGQDLYRDHDGRIRARTLDGNVDVDVIYRRVEDLELFVPGLRQSYREGHISLVNALGTGAADDKLVFLWVPEMIRHYLGEEPILRQPESYNLLDEKSRTHVMDNIDHLVIKSRGGYGGFGVAIGPELDAKQRAAIEVKLNERPEEYIGQEMIDFSKHLVFDHDSGSFIERHIDLRVFSLQDGNGVVTVPAGGLTRVSPSEDRITNNSAGGLCKPTWVVSPK